MDRTLARNLVCVVLVALYFAGLVCRFLGRLEAGIALWAVSTVGGFAALYHIRNGQQKEDARKQAKAADEEGGKPCE